MKNIIYKLGLFVLLGAGFVSCEEDRVTLPGNAPEQYAFENDRESFAVNETVTTHVVYFGATNISNVDRIIPISVDATSTATAAQYSVPATVTIPAGQYVGEFVITANPAELPDGETFTIVLNVDQNAYAFVDDSYFSIISMFKSCATESLAGVHTYSQYNMVQGGSGTAIDGTITGTSTWTESVSGTYSIPDLSFGHFAAVWGDAPANGDNTAAVQWTCNDGLIPLGYDQYDDVYTYNIISINGAVLTFDWFNTYGDAGTVELTRAGGENWPAELMP
jgi:hypothetical protein